MIVLSLFNGMSVAHQALTNLGVNVDKYYSSEIDQYAIAVTQSNYPETVQLGSVVGLDIDFQPDLMILGSPCQDLSIAKQGRKGLDGERSGLFWEAIRIHKQCKPKYFVYENVASMKKEWKQQMLEAIQEVEPSAYMIEINASLVSAQNRKRVFFTNIPNIQQPEDKEIYLKDILEHNVDEKYYVKNFNVNWRSDQPQQTNGKERALRVGVTNSLVFLGGIGDKDRAGDGKKLSRNVPQGNRVYDPMGKASTLSANGGGLGAKTGLYAVPVALRNRGSSKKPEYNGTGKANAMTSVQTDSMVEQDFKIRKLTPVECLRLQSMPDNYFDKAEIKVKPISDTQRYKMCGNAFNCKVIEHILGSIL